MSDLLQPGEWINAQDAPTPQPLLDAVGGSPIVAQLLARRGIIDPQQARLFLYPEAYTPAPGSDLPDMLRAVERVRRAIESGERIGVWGDFDMDGQTATALLVEAFTGLGADVIWHVPHREREGHGVNIPNLDVQLIDRGATLIVTCDTGIAAHEAVDHAARRNVDVVVTDHHQLPPTLPHAVANINPQLLPEAHPLRPLPGVATAYKLVQALYDALGRPPDSADHLLDLVALGTVADVAVLRDDARYLVQRGLRVLRTTGRVGLRALYRVAKLAAERLDEGSIGFGIAPRLNAAGRLGEPADGVRLLLTQDETEAEILARRLEGHNNERRRLTDDIEQAAARQIETDPTLLNLAVLVLAGEDWPAGIVGIVANRLVERYGRPVFLLRPTDDGGLTGSARSVAGLDITAAIKSVATSRPDLVARYGGHTMAAGVTLAPLPDALPDFRRALHQAAVDLGLPPTAPETLQIDGWLTPDALTLDLAHDLARLAPFGPGNPPLTFASRALTLMTARPIDRAGKHQRLILADDATGASAEWIWWNADLDALPKGRLDVAYTLGIDAWRGRESLQLTLQAVRPVQEAPRTFVARTLTPDDIDDYRGETPQVQWTIQQHYPRALFWVEGTSKVGGSGRVELRPAETFVIWTAPPGPDELAAALAAVNPARVVLVGVASGLELPGAFQRQLLGAIKHTLTTYDGVLDADGLNRMAAALAQRTSTVRLALRWRAALGEIAYNDAPHGGLVIEWGGIPEPDTAPQLEAQVHAALEETDAYRQHFRRADPLTLLDPPARR